MIPIPSCQRVWKQPFSVKLWHYNLQLENFIKLLKCFTGFSDDLTPQFWAFSLLKLLVSKSVSTNEELNAICHTALQRKIALLPFIFIFLYVVHKIQTIFTTNKIKRNNYNKTWDYANTVPIATRCSLGLNTKWQKHNEKKVLLRGSIFISHKK